jgi:hypothetical protein
LSAIHVIRATLLHACESNLLRLITAASGGFVHEPTHDSLDSPCRVFRFSNIVGPFFWKPQARATLPGQDSLTSLVKQNGTPLLYLFYGKNYPPHRCLAWYQQNRNKVVVLLQIVLLCFATGFRFHLSTARRESWYQLGELPSTEAKHMYVAAVSELLPSWTPESTVEELDAVVAAVAAEATQPKTGLGPVSSTLRGDVEESDDSFR